MTVTEDVLAEARRWIGTPYAHQASARGHGCDCLGLLRGVWRALCGGEPERIPAYSADWCSCGHSERLLEGLTRHMLPLPPDAWEIGDVLVFRLRRGGIAGHVGIASRKGANPCMIHAHSAAGVVETPIGPAWQRRLAGAFRFPERTR